ncbi:hypothetical protein KEM55_001807 [Ascosphaera atra]|nr:hypothetical protein KEM55_001807 [Ascosphaera atra]
MQHASRLDSVDKHWHLTSPTPYDPPLTYGGWTQARALGSRIAGLLNILEQDFESHKRGSSETSTASNDGVKGCPRRRRITIHTSPFLRCLQTAIAIAAGINQEVKPLRHASLPDDRIPYAVRPASATAASASSRPPLSPNLHPIPEPEHHPQDAPQTNTPQPHQLPGISKCKLKVDSFLGEWLCHEYFEENGVTPPPDSALMLAGAKAELMRHDEQLETGWSAFAGNSHHPQHQHQSTLQANVPLAHRDRSATTSSTHPHISLLPQQACSSAEQTSPPPPLYYIPPTPTYAISFGSLIPPGYVAHARDACVDVDHAWDSMRAPLYWGNGGEYGEEWSRMHDRFGKGLRRLVGWYESGMRDEEERGETAMKRRRQSKEAIEEGKEGGEGEEEEVDDVVILVSHGAGCNALLGELTGEPVLTDIPLTSLSMAVRKDLIHGDKASEDGRPVSASSSTSSRSVSMPGSPAQSRRSSLIYYAADPVIASPSFSQPAFRSRSHANSLLSNANSNSFTPCLSRSSSHSSMQSVEHHAPIATTSSKPHDHHHQKKYLRCVYSSRRPTEFFF